jgi:hypothetical protein
VLGACIRGIPVGVTASHGYLPRLMKAMVNHPAAMPTTKITAHAM